MLATNTPYAETQRHATPLGEKSAVGLCLRVNLLQAQFRRDDPPSSHEYKGARKRKLLTDPPGKQRLAQNHVETMRTQRYLRIVLFLQRCLVAGAVAVPLKVFFKVLAPYLYSACCTTGPSTEGCKAYASPNGQILKPGWGKLRSENTTTCAVREVVLSSVVGPRGVQQFWNIRSLL